MLLILYSVGKIPGQFNPCRVLPVTFLFCITILARLLCQQELLSHSGWPRQSLVWVRTSWLPCITISHQCPHLACEPAAMSSSLVGIKTTHEPVSTLWQQTRPSSFPSTLWRLSCKLHQLSVAGQPTASTVVWGWHRKAEKLCLKLESLFRLHVVLSRAFITWTAFGKGLFPWAAGGDGD